MLFSQFINLSSSELFANPKNGFTTSKMKRRPAGTPDPDAEIISLSPNTLMESDRYVCEICNHGFQREQNLQMHRRCHKVPWEKLKRKSADAKKRVYVCPEPTCMHHHPSHALGDLVGIKKHFRRKHSGHKQWVCEKCFKGYAVQADYKAHLKTCGTRGHTCDCGRVFSRIDIFMEHQDRCRGSNVYTKLQPPQGACRSRATSSTSIPLDLNSGVITTTTPLWMMPEERRIETLSSQLSLSICSLSSDSPKTPFKGMVEIEDPQLAASRLKDEAREHWRIAMVDKALAEEKRQQAKWQIEMAKQELVKAQIIRQQALADLNEAQVLKDSATKHFWPSILQITCHSCKKEFQILGKGN